MATRTRMIFLGVSVATLLLTGWIATGGLRFLLGDFWFTAGLFLLLLLSLVDQPHFSRDASIFVNGSTAWISLLLVPSTDRSGFWWFFFAWAIYLIVASYLLMWIRSRSLVEETRPVQLVSRVNRQIGRPEAIFSAFFLWGCIRQFGIGSPQLQPLFLFWAAFMILNLPAIARALDSLLSPKPPDATAVAGALTAITSPRTAEVTLSSDLDDPLVGRLVRIRTRRGVRLAEGIIVDDRIVAGSRIGRVSLTSLEQGWSRVGTEGASGPIIDLLDGADATDGEKLVGVVDVGTTIGMMIVHTHPEKKLQEGEILAVAMSNGEHAYYQIVSASVCESILPESNAAQTVRVAAGQLGVWKADSRSFQPVPWVAPAGRIVRRIEAAPQATDDVPERHTVVGCVPNSGFPIHVDIEDLVTHNAAAIGVTGSGKSYLAFHLIEAIVGCGIKVMILDITREHDLYLDAHSPTALRVAGDVEGWFASDSMIGIHQYAVDDKGYPAVTADFAKAAFAEVSKAKLERGKNLPARLCVVLEEAHSLIPEWNQVAMKGDEQHVNRTARALLQGRKFGMGALVITQRTANVTKTILNQCNTMFAFQSFDQTGLDFLRNYMGEEYSQAICTLPTRHAILVGKASSSARPVIFNIPDFEDRWSKAPDEGTQNDAGGVLEDTNGDEIG